jgi:hypothetical protein
VKFFHVVRQCRHFLNQLFQKTREKVFKRLLMLPPEITIEIRNTNIGVFLEVHSEEVDHNGRHDCLARSRDARTEQRLLRSY